MKFCLDIRTVGTTFPGIGRYSANLARSIPPLLNEDELLTLIVNPSADLSDLTHPRVTFETAISTPFLLSQQWEIPRLLKRMKAKVYHSPYLLMPYFTRVPTVVTVHDLIPMLLPKLSSLKARLFFKWALHMALRTSDQTITVSENTQKDLLARTRHPINNVHVIPSGVSENFRPASLDEKNRVRAKLNLPERYVLYLSSDRPHKNIERLINAWSLVETEASLVIAGIKSKHHFSSAPGVHLLSHVDDQDLAGLYSGSDLFVFPSLYEGFGLPVLEAMASGIPVACSSSSSLPEVAGDAAEYFDPLDESDMAGKISGLIQNQARRESLVSKGLERAAMFSWTRTAQLTLDIYRSMARAKGGVSA